MIAGDQPGVARTAYRRLKTAAGVADLSALEHRVADLEAENAESRDLERQLRAVIDRVEAAVVPLLDARVARHQGRARRADGERGTYRDPGHGRRCDPPVTPVTSVQ